MRRGGIVVSLVLGVAAGAALGYAVASWIEPVLGSQPYLVLCMAAGEWAMASLALRLYTVASSVQHRMGRAVLAEPQHVRVAHCRLRASRGSPAAQRAFLLVGALGAVCLWLLVSEPEYARMFSFWGIEPTRVAWGVFAMEVPLSVLAVLAGEVLVSLAGFLYARTCRVVDVHVDGRGISVTEPRRRGSASLRVEWRDVTRIAAGSPGFRLIVWAGGRGAMGEGEEAHVRPSRGDRLIDLYARERTLDKAALDVLYAVRHDLLGEAGYVDATLGADVRVAVLGRR